MPQRNYLISTTALSLTPSGTTIGSGNTTSATFALARTIARTGIEAGELSSGSRTWSIHYVVSAMTTPYEMQFKLQRLNSSGVVQSESGFGTARSAIGTFDDNITWDSGTWAANDQLALVWEHRRPSGTGSKNGTVDANGSSYIDAPLPIVVTTVIPSPISATVTGFAPSLKLTITPTVNSLTATPFASSLRTVIIPGVANLTTAQFASALDLRITPVTQDLNITIFTVSLNESITPSLSTLTTSTFAPVLTEGITPAAVSISITSFTPTLIENATIVVSPVTLSLATRAPHILPARIIYLDPGGDATKAVGHFNTDVNTTGLITYDNTQQVAGVGSYKFNSDTGVEVPAGVNGVLDNMRRVSAYFRHDSQPDATETATEFVDSFSVVYSGGGFVDDLDVPGTGNLTSDDGIFNFATPARNAGQGNVFGVSGAGLDVPAGAVIDLVKIIYKRKYDTDTSIGISRVKSILDDEEGPDHDNTDMPLTDTVVEVDVTGDRTWEWQHFTGDRFQVIAEARRGDTDTAHTQSWDYLKVEVVYHLPAAIMAGLTVSNQTIFRIAIRPLGTYAVLRFVDGAGNSYDGITRLLVDTAYQISFAYIYHAADNLDIALFVNGIPELLIHEASTAGLSKPVNLHYGWLLNPGADHLCWFTHLYIDDGDDLTDPGNALSTAKLSAAVNENNWDTVGGTGAVNERPLSETNYIMQSAFSSVRQTYTLQTAATGDVDISGESLLGYMGWAWAKREAGSVERIGLIVNNVDVTRSSIITTSPSLLKLPVTSTSYPSHAAGIGMSSNSEDAGVFVYECGAVQAYRGPLNPDILLQYQQVNSETLATITDDLRADPPDSYEVCCTFDDFDGSVEIIIHSLDQDGGSLSYQGTLYSKGRIRITPGVEVQLDVTVVGVTNLQIWRRINFD